MVAYNFQPRFVAPIVGLTKLGTIRGKRSRHVQPGDELQLYTGMRTKACRLIARAVCARVDPIRISFERDKISIGGYPSERPIIVVDKTTAKLLDDFACEDGFNSWVDMVDFFHGVHGPGVFHGIWIQWNADSVWVAL